MLNALKGVMGENGHVLERNGDLYHVKSDARLKSLRRVIFIDGDYHDGCCTKKFVDGFGLEKNQGQWEIGGYKKHVVHKRYNLKFLLSCQCRAIKNLKL